MQRIEFRGKECFFVDTRIKVEDRRDDYNYYECRYQDGDSGKINSIERGVMVNFYGTLITKHDLAEFIENPCDDKNSIYILDDVTDEEFDKEWQIDFFGKEVTEDMEEYSLFDDYCNVNGLA